MFGEELHNEEKSTFVADLALASLAKALPSVACQRRGDKRGEYWIAIGATLVADVQASKTIESSVCALNNTEGVAPRLDSAPVRVFVGGA